jgi:hypothetical protein
MREGNDSTGNTFSLFTKGCAMTTASWVMNTFDDVRRCKFSRYATGATRGALHVVTTDPTGI